MRDYSVSNVMQKVILFGVIALTAVFNGCSFITDLVVINLSDKPVQVSYRIKDYPGPFNPPETPAIKTRAHMDDDSPWSVLSADQYKFNPEGRRVTVSLQPQTALLIDRVRGPRLPDDSESFAIDEIMIVGAYGMVVLKGEQVRRSFAPESDGVYSLTYK
jgi:hypothetical protein